MALLPIQNPQNATGSNKEIFDSLQKQLGVVPNMMKVMGNSPAVLKAYAQFSGALAGGSLSAKARELIAVLSAETNGCTYCLSAHSVLGQRAGLTASQIEDARQGESDDGKTRAVLALAAGVIDSRGRVGQEGVERARAAGLSDAEIAEVVAATALNIFTNYFNETFMVDVDFPRVEAAGHARR